MIMPAEALSTSVICDEHQSREKHEVIRRENPSLPRCGYFGKFWPKEINVDDSDGEVILAADLRRASSSTTGYISSEGRGLPNLTRSRSPASSSSSSLGRSVNLKQFSHFEKMRREANLATRAIKEASPFENPVGLKIRVKALHSFGYNLTGGFFKASKTSQLGIILTSLPVIPITNSLVDSLDLPLIPWRNLRFLSRDSFISDYLIRLGLPLRAIDGSNIQFGVSFERIGKSDTGTFISIAFEHEPCESIEEIFNPDANYAWAVEDGRAVLWIDIRFVEDQSIQQPKKPRVKSKERSLLKPPNSIINDAIEEESRSTTADLTEDIKGVVIREAISVIAFPPAQAARSDSEAQQEDQENQAQIEYEDGAQEASRGRRRLSRSSALKETATGPYNR